jgi:hypothetical protein
MFGARRQSDRTKATRRRYLPQLEVLEDRTVLSANSVTVGVVGDYGVASSVLNLANFLTGVPTAEGDVARLIHDWNPDILTTLGDNNYLAGEQFDTNFTLDLQVAISLGAVTPSTVRSFLDDLDKLPVPGLALNATGTTTAGSNTVTGVNVQLDEISVGMVVYDTDPTDANIPFPTGPSSPYFTTITGISGSSGNVTLTLSANAGKSLSPPNPAKLTLLPANISLQSLDNLSHIDRNIGRYYSDFIYPYITSSPAGQFGNGSLTGTNRMFPTPGNHDWADPFSDGGTSLSDEMLALPSEAIERIGTLNPDPSNGTITLNNVTGLRAGMSILGPGLPFIDPSSQLSLGLSVVGLARVASITTNANSVTGDTAMGNPVVQHVNSLLNLRVGMQVSGTGIPTGATIISLDSSNPSNLKFTLSAAPTATNSGLAMVATDYTITLNQKVPNPPVAPGGTPNSTYAFVPLFADSFSFNIGAPNLDPYLNFFAGLNPTNSPNFQIGTTRDANGNPVDLTQPYYYSFTVGTAPGGQPLLEFFGFDSDPADPELLRNPNFTFTGAATADVADITGINVATWNNLGVGMEVSGAGIPAGATIAAKPSSGTITLAVSPTVSGTVTLSLRPAALFTGDIDADGVTVKNISFSPLTTIYGGIYSFAVGMEINGPGIPAHTKIAAMHVDSGSPQNNTLTLDTSSTPGTTLNLSMINSFNVANSNEGVWLQNALADSQAVWKIPMFHHSPYTSSFEPDEGPNGQWMQLPFQQWGASAVLYGHVHNYERLSEVDPAIPGVSAAGTVAIPYILNGSGGAPLGGFNGPQDPGSLVRYSGANGAMKVVADAGHITFQFINTFGALIDQLTLESPIEPIHAGTVAADFDHDGNKDVLWRQESTGQVWIWRMNGTQLQVTNPYVLLGTSPSGNDWQITGTGDFDKDGNQDILWRQTTSGQVWIWRMNGTQLQATNPYVLLGTSPAGDDWQATGTGDFDKDGNQDILWRQTSSGQVWIWRMNATQPQASNPYVQIGTSPSGNDWQITGTGDFDKDGNQDILWRQASTSQLWLWRLNGTQLQPTNPFVQITAPPLDSDWRIGETGDFDKDGNIDILWRQISTGAVWIWKMNGTQLQFPLFVANSPAGTDWQIGST